MASIKKKKNCKNWFARFSDINGKPVEKTTKIADCGTPKERADAKRRALVNDNYFSPSDDNYNSPLAG